MLDSKGILAPAEPHPSAQLALDYVQALPPIELARWQEAFASNAISGNRGAEVCGETLSRILKGGSVSDRYILGLAWYIKYGEK